MNESLTLKKALYTIRKLKKLLVEQEKNQFLPIAIIGMSCRFPQVENISDYWQLLIDGKNIISKLPEHRKKLLEDTNERVEGNSFYNGWGGFLDNITKFDNHFFGITPREALRMDPQQRLLLEVAYEAIEDAGITTHQLAGSKCGVFASLYANPFLYMQTLDNDIDALYLPTGNATSMAANRLSYFFDLKGPSVVIDTACSSSLVSLQLACMHLNTNLCDLALVGAANINLHPYINLILTKAKMLSPDGQCKTFDAGANGYVQGEGIGMVVIKPLAKALQDKDRIYAVIAGCAVNQDGKTNGLTAPNGLRQEEMLTSVYNIAQVDPNHISYVECHGTGTVLGDPIEIEALGKIISKQRRPENPCWIGSVKTNLGHLEPAAGIASLIKVALALKHRKIPPHLNLSTPNPLIDFKKYHLKVPQTVQEWAVENGYRIAGISGFGFGGTNAHVVLRELKDEEQQH